MTLNNPTEEDIQVLLDYTETLGSVTRRGIWQLEIGESGTPHLQGYVYFKNPKSKKGCINFWEMIFGHTKTHVEPRYKFTTCAQAWTYCTPEYPGKEDDNPVTSWGERPIEGVSDDPWASIMQMVKDGFSDLEIIEAWPGHGIRNRAAIGQYRLALAREKVSWTEMDVTYISGPSGCGKTRSILYDENGQYNHDVYRVTDKKHPWDGYNGQKIVLFEEFRSSYKIEEMLNWIDGHPCELPARYAPKMKLFDTVYIVSNWKFEEQYIGQQTGHEGKRESFAAFKRRITTFVDMHESDNASSDIISKKHQDANLA